MITKEEVDRWLAKGIIAKDQAEKILNELVEYKKDQSSSKLIYIVSVIGALLIGISAIMLVASNWEKTQDFIKILLLSGSTFTAYYIGYLFKYQNHNLPKVGTALIFLGALLFGATIFLIAQIYNINANSHILILIWLAGILPFVYLFLSLPIAKLASVLFFIWFGFFIFQNKDFINVFNIIFVFPAIYLIAGILMHEIGQLHYFSDKLKAVADIYKLVGRKVIMISFFFTHFQVFF